MVLNRYLNAEELDLLNRLVSMYLDFAELQAKNRKPMHMKDWIAKLDDFIRLNERELLTHAGKITHQQAVEKAQAEYDKYHSIAINEPSLVEQHFKDAMQLLEQVEKEYKETAV